MRSFVAMALCGFLACGSPTVSPTDAGSDVVIDNVVSGGNPDAGEAGTFDVATFPGLVLWLDATRGLTTDGGTIASWADQSKSAIVLTGSVHPQGVLALDPSAMNGHPAVTLSGPVDFYDPQQPISALTWGNDDFLLELVVKASGSPRIFNLTEGLQTLDLSLDFSSGIPTGTTTGAGPVVVSSPSPVVGPHLVAIQQKTATVTVDLRVDGLIVASASGTGNPTAPTKLELGYGGANVGDDSAIAEIVLVHGATSDANRDALEAHLRARYGL